MTAYEELVTKLLSKPFKVPIPDYIPDTHGNRCLGLRRTIMRRALHDPYACNALVLYTPPDEQVKVSVHEKLLQDKSKILVHVVVDPVVGNILRPHQREGVQFMYDCVTGAKGDFHGCIMADEVNILLLSTFIQFFGIFTNFIFTNAYIFRWVWVRFHLIQFVIFDWSL